MKIALKTMVSSTNTTTERFLADISCSQGNITENFENVTSPSDLAKLPHLFCFCLTTSHCYGLSSLNYIYQILIQVTMVFWNDFMVPVILEQLLYTTNETNTLENPAVVFVTLADENT
ncbi:hypothetical protein E2C01_002718 [Portunus trituberculatus]|uniref:Uncharacterized protein n=1 Tax=Portunus trituberculatus TaxID=210409 RepID=A0A5B7CL19_PORTR|nr:hypothetical protein [Portunus trituberculatus]